MDEVDRGDLLRDLKTAEKYLTDALAQPPAHVPGGGGRIWSDVDKMRGLLDTVKRARELAEEDLD